MTSKAVFVARLGWVQRVGSKTLPGTGSKGSVAIRLLGLVALGSLWMRACQAVSLCWTQLLSHKNERALNPSQRVLLSLHHSGV